MVANRRSPVQSADRSLQRLLRGCAEALPLLGSAQNLSDGIQRALGIVGRACSYSRLSLFGFSAADECWLASAVWHLEPEIAGGVDASGCDHGGRLVERLTAEPNLTDWRCDGCSRSTALFPGSIAGYGSSVLSVEGSTPEWRCSAEERATLTLFASAITGHLAGTAIRAPDAATSERTVLEERIARLTEANAEMDRALQRLADDATPDGFVRNLQREMIELLGGRCSAQFRVHRNSLMGGVIFVDGNFVPDESIAGLRDSEVPSAPGILANPRPTVLTLADDPCLISEFTVTFMKERALSWLVNFPLFVSGQPAWILAVLGDNSSKLTSENLDRFAALSRQLTLALQLNHMHDDARKSERARTIAEERTSMARDIHDTLAQGFAAICMRLQAAQRESGFQDTPAAVRDQIALSLDISSSHLVHARNSIRSLRPESADYFRLDEALELLITQMETDLPLTSRVRFAPSPVPGAIGVELFRIAQEALTNAAKHAGASRVTLQVAPAEGDGLMIVVGDNGKGFDGEQRSDGFGLIGMQERANRIQARLTVASEPGRGTEVIVVWNPESGAARVR